MDKKPEFSEYTRQLSDFSIADAALLTMGIDPEDHHISCEQTPGYAGHFEDHPGGGEVQGANIALIVSAVNAGIISVTVPHRRAESIWDLATTKISKVDLIAWWRKHGYDSVAAALEAAAAQRCATGKNNASALPAHQDVKSSARAPENTVHERGTEWSEKQLLELLAQYGNGQTQEQLASTHGVARQRISRLLEDARSLQPLDLAKNPLSVLTRPSMPK